MKLYYAPGACSLSPHIVACEAGIDLELCKVDLREKKTEDGADFLEINPKGFVPALRIDDGEVLTEGPAIVQFLADLKPDSGLAPPAGSRERYRLQEWLNFIAAELHKSFVPLFWGGTETEKDHARNKIRERFDYVEERLQHDYLLGDDFTVADAYLFTIANWLDRQDMDTSSWPRLQEFQERVRQRPGARKALREEGLLGD
ncbi:glutathione transferase GstA [Microbulbifer yueqingensis]|uniref:Glutathione S-transferase n=1 Tax=Microbulbifer yueqingensis TaxID=658219 RepID=A0A1G9BQJ6_9GAMM|nr:glutathione transferase GstA [Microbulbifer yueqingensis]SDK41520.1 glutathione S-transferase [Microbulbifer yueqingensis]